jgi:outer membrane protein assembly factor BamB
MSRARLICLVAGIASLLVTVTGGQISASVRDSSRTLPEILWTGFMGGPAHRGDSGCDLLGPDLREVWRFQPGDHVWSYQHRAGPWSTTIASVTLDGRTLIFAGSYDHNLYAVDARSGHEVWRFTTGGRIDAAPVLYLLDDRAILALVSADRSVYALDAATGEVRWTREVHPWSLTVPPAIAGAPCVITTAAEPMLICTLWINDHKPFHNTQEGQVLALHAATGAVAWRRTLSSAPLTAPAVARIDDEPLLIVAAEEGRLHALDPATGAGRWERRLNAPLHASPSCGRIEGKPVVVIGDDYGMLTCLDAATGDPRWQYKAGHALHASAAWVRTGDTELCVCGSFDRKVHAVDAHSGRRRWVFGTGDLVRATPLAVRAAGQAMVAVYSMDRQLYLLDAATGLARDTFTTGGYLWPLYTRGESVGASPGVARAGAQPLLILPGDDGVLYALTASDALARRER